MQPDSVGLGTSRLQTEKFEPLLVATSIRHARSKFPRLSALDVYSCKVVTQFIRNNFFHCHDGINLLDCLDLTSGQRKPKLIVEDSDSCECQWWVGVCNLGCIECTEVTPTTEALALEIVP